MARTLRILLVEDDPEDALLFRRRCPPGAQLQHVTELQAALALLRQGATDVCFTDYRLGPAMGLDLIRAARREGLRVPMVVITGQDIESLGENALLAGATDFVPKDNLDAATIQRVARWALIRRHVENQREDLLGDTLLIQLMGEAPRPLPPAMAPATGADALRRVLYISQARRSFSQAELLSLCAGFAARNARTQVTGFLVQLGNCFLQLIEGEPPAIEVLLRAIQADARHSDMTIVLDEPISARAFGHWNMGCFNLNIRYEFSPSKWLSLLSALHRILEPMGADREHLIAMVRVLPELLAKHTAQAA